MGRSAHADARRDYAAAVFRRKPFAILSSASASQRPIALLTWAMFDFSVREALNKKALRRMAVLRPLKVVIENYPQGQVEELEAVNHPDNPGGRHAQD